MSKGNKTESVDASKSQQTTIATDLDGLRRTFTSLTESKSGVKVHVPASDLTFGATFFELDPSGLTLTPEPGLKVQSLPPLSLCSLYFTQGVLTCTAFTRLRESKAATATEPARIVLESPDHLIQIEARSSERVPIHSNSGMSAFVYHGGVLHRAKPVNLSVGGMLVDFGAPVEGIEVDVVVQVQASLNGLTINMPALVRWTEGGLCGLFFNAQRGRDDLEQMVRILSELALGSAA